MANQDPRETLDGVPFETISGIIEGIYDCALDPSSWPNALGKITELSRTKVCGFVIAGQGTQRNLAFHIGVEEHYVRLYENTYAALNPHLGPLQLLPVGEVVTTPMLLDQHEFLESRFYREFLRPQGLRDAIGFNVLKTQKRMGALAATRLESEGPFRDPEIHFFGLLAPHICRSVAISDALDLRAINLAALEATLDGLASGVFLTNRDCCVVYMNPAAADQLRSGNAVRVINNRLTAMDGTARAVLAEAITQPSSGGITVALPAIDGGLIATVLPLNRGQRQNIGWNLAATAAIFTQDPKAVSVLPGEAFAKLYGLTGSEFRVLRAMSPGLSVKEAAEVLGMGETTAKTHLQHIYAKTGTSKQTQLMKLFLGSSPPVQAKHK